MRSGWLLREGDVICALEMTDSFGERVQGLRGRPGVEGAVHLGGSRWAHSAGVPFEIDVAFLSVDLLVLRLVRLKPWRLARGGGGVGSVLQTRAGGFERWGVRMGDQLVIREVV
jgi:uncharacterized membrane protein (UPF0127 family)